MVAEGLLRRNSRRSRCARPVTRSNKNSRKRVRGTSERRTAYFTFMSRRADRSLRCVTLITATALPGLATLACRTAMPKPGKFPEQLVFARSKDDVVNGGVMFTPPKEAAKSIAVVWIPGWGTNFYSPTYVAIGRALAERGLTTIVGNTRMHDIGNVIGYRGGKRVRGGGYWGVTSEDNRDIGAWIDFSEQSGFKRVVLVGHSAGWSSVGKYQANAQDPRVQGPRSGVRSHRFGVHRRKRGLEGTSRTACRERGRRRINPASEPVVPIVCQRRHILGQCEHPPGVPGFLRHANLKSGGDAGKMPYSGFLRNQRRCRRRRASEIAHLRRQAACDRSACSRHDNDPQRRPHVRR